MKLKKKEYWNGLTFPSPGNIPDPGIKHGSPALQAGSLPSYSSSQPSMNISEIVSTMAVQFYLGCLNHSCSILTFKSSPSSIATADSKVYLISNKFVRSVKNFQNIWSNCIIRYWIYIHLIKVTKDLKSKYRSLKDKSTQSVIKGSIPRKL